MILYNGMGSHATRAGDAEVLNNFSHDRPRLSCLESVSRGPTISGDRSAALKAPVGDTLPSASRATQSAREMVAEKSAKTRARAFGAWRVHANRSATSRAKALAFWRAKALRDLRAYAVAWSDAACSSRHDEHRRAKGAFAIWRRRATAAKNAKYALHRYVSSFLPSRRKARVFNAWAGVAKYRAYFASEVAKELVAEMSLAKTLRRCAARNLARRWIRRWHAVTRFAHLRALGHWAAWTAAKTLGAWRGSAIGGRRHRERRAAAEALRVALRWEILPVVSEFDPRFNNSKRLWFERALDFGGFDASIMDERRGR